MPIIRIYFEAIFEVIITQLNILDIYTDYCFLLLVA
jgi:hypothetical protein